MNKKTYGRYIKRAKVIDKLARSPVPFSSHEKANALIEKKSSALFNDFIKENIWQYCSIYYEQNMESLIKLIKFVILRKHFGCSQYDDDSDLYLSFRDKEDIEYIDKDIVEICILIKNIVDDAKANAIHESYYEI